MFGKAELMYGAEWKGKEQRALEASRIKAPSAHYKITMPPIY